MRPRPVWLVAAVVLCHAVVAEAAPVKVRLPEGTARGFLVVKTLQGEPIGYGELRPIPRGGLIESAFTLSFKDGSVREETVTFSQHDVLRLEAYRLRQRGPSFPSMEISFDRRSGRYRATVQQTRNDEPKSAEGTLEMPPDLYNGMALVVLKNLPEGASVSARMAVFLPTPRLIRMELGPESQERVFVGAQARPAVRYLVNLEVGGVAGTIAALVGKDPPDLRYWLVTGPVPAFVRFQGAMFLNGPQWRVELTPVEWPN
jgi:hypothetical protein